MNAQPPDTSKRTHRTRPGMREVAARAGVAMSSVSRVLSGHPDVSEQMHATVMAAVADLGYRPDLLAQGLRSQKTFSVGFTVSDISNPVLAASVTGAERRLRAAGYSLLLTNSEGSAELDADHIRLLDQRRVDGLLLSLADERHTATATALLALEVPFVLVDRDLPPGVEAHRVLFDHRAGMRAAAEHLLALGHREIALISGGPQRPAEERRLGIEETLAHAGASCLVLRGEFDIEHGQRATEQILQQTPRPTAIIASGNVLMHGALRALKIAGVRVGEEISFIGCDDTAVAEFHDPPIAVVRRDIVRIGTIAAEILLAELDGDLDVEDQILPTEFVARPSVAPARIATT